MYKPSPEFKAQLIAERKARQEVRRIQRAEQMARLEARKAAYVAKFGKTSV